MLWKDPVVIHIFFTFFRGYEGNPLSPPEGEAAQGEHPLDPLSFSPVSKEIFSSTFYRIVSGCPTARTKASEHFPMISTEPNDTGFIR